MMEKVQFKVNIHAPVATVYDIMLGITDKQTYEQWTALFNPTSTYSGSWSKGSKIQFIGIDENGEKGGMLSEIVDAVADRYVSIRHYGLIKSGLEITDGPDVEKWANGNENYTFEESNGTTTVTVDLDTAADFVDYMNETYPKALDKLKALCERV